MKFPESGGSLLPLFCSTGANTGGLDRLELRALVALAAWFDHVNGRVVHIHVKDIAVEQPDAERGKALGTAVGCACGGGVAGCPVIIEICRTLPRDIVLSVECGALEQANRSIKYLRPII